MKATPSTHPKSVVRSLEKLLFSFKRLETKSLLMQDVLPKAVMKALSEILVM